MNKDEILTLLKGVKEEAREKYNVEIKGIFGSYVRGKATEQSDIDVLVDSMIMRIYLTLWASLYFLRRSYITVRMLFLKQIFEKS